MTELIETPNVCAIPIEEIVRDVYESADPSEKTRMVSLLVGKVFADAPPPEKLSVIEQLTKPLGILSLIAVANGIFAKIRFRGSLPDMQARMEDLQVVQVSDVVALASYAQQVSIQAVDGLAQTLTSSTLLTGSAAALLLLNILIERSKTRRETDRHT